MAVNEDEESELPKLDAAIKQKGVGNTCPMCGSGEWFLMTGQTSLRKNASHPTYAVPMITLICTNCGLARQHAEFVLFDGKVR